MLLLFITNFFGQEIERESGFYFVKAKDSTSKYLDINDDYSIEDALITIEFVKNIKIINSKTRPYRQIELEFNDEGKQIWEQKTDEFAGEKISFLYDNEVVNIVQITVKITSGKVNITSENPNYSLEELFEKLKILVNRKE